MRGSHGARTLKERALGVEEERQQIGSSHSCGQFQFQASAPSHEDLRDLLTLIPQRLGKPILVIKEPIHWHTRVDSVSFE